MTRDGFNKVFDTYRQEAIKVLEGSIDQSLTQPTPAVQLLRQHVQEWKQHYEQQDQTIQQVRAKYQLRRQGTDQRTEFEKGRLRSDEECECQQVTSTFNLMRETIWQRQQVELTNNRISL